MREASAGSSDLEVLCRALLEDRLLITVLKTCMCRYINGHILPFHFPASDQERDQEFLGAYEDRRGNLWAFCATYLINLTKGKRINYFPGEKSAAARVWRGVAGAPPSREGRAPAKRLRAPKFDLCKTCFEMQGL